MGCKYSTPHHQAVTQTKGIKMNCPKCTAEMKAKVINDPFDGELAFLECSGCGKYTKALFQPSMVAVLASRMRISILALQV